MKKDLDVLYLAVLAVLFCFGSVSAEDRVKTDPLSPYGVCSHLGGGEEHDLMPKNLQIMYQGGMRWVRSDYTWSGVERPQGQWDFKRFDRLLAEAEKNGMTILPILDYGTAWATPAYKHLDHWTEYVRRIVTRYKDKIRYWEVWNEENLRGFWADDPDPVNYALLLKETYKTIKAIDPDLKVVYGGLAGVPADFFEGSLKADAGKYFDVMNIHPYRGGLLSMPLNQRFIDDIDKFNLLMDKYGIARKPIWITEMGWATPPNFEMPERMLINGAIKKIFPNGVPGKAAVLFDKTYEPSLSINDASIEGMFPAGLEYEYIQIKQIKDLDIKRFPILYLPPTEAAPSPFFDDLVKYVKRGGTLIVFGGVPFYYESEMINGVISKTEKTIGEKYRSALRIGWRAWWTVKDTPKEAPVQIAKESIEVFKGYYPVFKGTRFFTDKLLKPGDRMIPLFNGKLGNFEEPVAAIYQFNSDFKGNVVASMLMESGNGTNISTVENQGVFLPQALLLAFSAGIERYFWYEFQAPEQDDSDKEHHFGIVHRDLTPKPGYVAYQALVKARPSGSVQKKNWRSGDCCLVEWKRPDGKNGFAIWSPDMPKTKSIKITGSVVDAFDYLGKPISFDSESKTIELNNKIIYLIGPGTIELQ